MGHIRPCLKINSVKWARPSHIGPRLLLVFKVFKYSSSLNRCILDWPILQLFPDILIGSGEYASHSKSLAFSKNRFPAYPRRPLSSLARKILGLRHWYIKNIIPDVTPSHRDCICCKDHCWPPHGGRIYLTDAYYLLLLVFCCNSRSVTPITEDWLHTTMFRNL